MGIDALVVVKIAQQGHISFSPGVWQTANRLQYDNPFLKGIMAMDSSL